MTQIYFQYLLETIALVPVLQITVLHQVPQAQVPQAPVLHQVLEAVGQVPTAEEAVAPEDHPVEEAHIVHLQLQVRTMILLIQNRQKIFNF